MSRISTSFVLYLRNTLKRCESYCCLALAATLLLDSRDAGIENISWQAAMMNAGSRQRFCTVPDQNLLGSFNMRKFKGRMRMDVSSFEYLCSTPAPLL
jgi:hypothetical protein